MPPRIRIDGLKLIAAYLNLSEGKVRQLYRVTVSRDLRLPVWTLSPGGARNAELHAWKDELDAWVNRMSERDLHESR